MFEVPNPQWRGGSGSFGNWGGRRSLKSLPSVVGLCIFSGVTHSYIHLWSWKMEIS